jgi:hypothetical protein
MAAPLFVPLRGSLQEVPIIGVISFSQRNTAKHNPKAQC